MTHLGSPQELYEIIEQIGDGSFGTVHKAKNKISGKLYAVKIMKRKYSTLEECESQFEPKLLSLLPPHVNIVQMYDSFLSPTTCDLSFVMEYSNGGNLYQLMRERKQHNLPFSHCELRRILHQILSAVSHIHHHHIFHRDMKPENLLLDYSSGKPVIKLADFGLARKFISKPPYTEYVSTRWYRAPEVLLRSTEYTASVDLWAVGAIFAELINLEPLFPGESEIDQIYRICSVLGSPGNKTGVVGQKSHHMLMRPEKRISPGFARKKTKDVNDSELRSLHIHTGISSTISSLDGGGEWKEGVKLAYKMGFKFPQLSPKPLELVIPAATESMIDMIRHFLFFNPQQRWSADFALRHKFFSETEEPAHPVIPISAMIEPITPPEQQASVLISNNMNNPHNESLQQPSIITPLDLLSTPAFPYQVCPDWNIGHSDSSSSSHSKRSITSSYTTHVDRFLHGSDNVENNTTTTITNNSWLAQSRPIYSSHQKVHPINDNRPGPSLGLNNSYSYATTYLRPSTPIPSSDKDVLNPTAKRYSSEKYTTIDENNHPKRPSLLVGHRPSSNNTSFHLDRIPHYGAQLIKWAPPYYSFVHSSQHSQTDSRRQTRTPQSLTKQKYSPIYTAIPSTTSSANKGWSTSSTAVETADKTFATNSYSSMSWTMKHSEKPLLQRKVNSILPQRFNSWIADEDDKDLQYQSDENNGRPVFLPLPLQ
ncbi:MAG: kinase-like domain-containing protein [Benjaminiella poitrasii]|nr:MAG: kinase-like domain-containing protein [Benjaminiella poitrasii]